MCIIYLDIYISTCHQAKTRQRACLAQALLEVAATSSPWSALEPLCRYGHRIESFLERRLETSPASCSWTHTCSRQDWGFPLRVAAIWHNWKWLPRNCIRWCQQPERFQVVVKSYWSQFVDVNALIPQWCNINKATPYKWCWCISSWSYNAQQACLGIIHLALQNECTAMRVKEA